MTEGAFDQTMVWPMAAVVSITIVSGLHLVRLRIRAVKAGFVPLSFYRNYGKGREPKDVAVATRHFTNLFETPVLFYVGCIVSGLMGPANAFGLAIAWLYVVFRLSHSIVHLTSNNVLRRAQLFWISCIFLIALWINILVAAAIA